MDNPKQESFRSTRRSVYLGLGLALLVTGANACSSEPECVTHSGVRYGLDENEISALLGEDGVAIQGDAWGDVSEAITKLTQPCESNLGFKFEVNARVAHGGHPGPEIDAQAVMLARLASEYLGLPQGDAADVGYDGELGLATIHIVRADA